MTPDSACRRSLAVFVDSVAIRNLAALDHTHAEPWQASPFVTLGRAEVASCTSEAIAASVADIAASVPVEVDHPGAAVALPEVRPLDFVLGVSPGVGDGRLLPVVFAEPRFLQSHGNRMGRGQDPVRPTAKFFGLFATLSG
jgi:hypothetical protein